MSEAAKMLKDAIEEFKATQGRNPHGVVGSTTSWQKLVLETAQDSKPVTKAVCFLGVPIKVDDSLPEGEFFLLESLF
jgi:hypothetical protein